MKNKAKHTPTDWKIAGDDDCFVLFRTGDRSYRFVCTTDSSFDKKYLTEEEKAEDRANAELIVRAVNAHDELITALKDCLPFVERYCTQNGLNKYIHTKLANDAIAKAEGGQ